MRFAYQNGEPQVIVRFFSPKRNEWIPFVAYVDSGATYSIFHTDVAQLLDIDIKKGEQVHVTVGNGEKIPVYLHKTKTAFADSQFIATIGFSPQLGVEINLMGQKDFFERFRMCFDTKHKFLDVTKL